MKPIVGYAKTATCRAREASSKTGKQALDDRFGYWAYLDAGPKPAISVVQDLDGAQAGFGAFWGEVNSNIHKAFGCLGTVTNGSIRDLDMFADGFQAIAGLVGPSHAHVHLVDYAVDVNVLGMVVKDGDLVHADCHGASSFRMRSRATLSRRRKCKPGARPSFWRLAHQKVSRWRS